MTTDLALAMAFVVLSWWLSTALVLRVVWLGPRRQNLHLVLATVLAIGCTVCIGATAHDTSKAASFVSFGCALGVWAWHELAFLLGIVTGSHKEPCPENARGWARFRLATGAVLYHEVGLALTQAMLVGITWKQPNQIGTSTFAVLLVMRLSAKLNLFLGVRSFTSEFVPLHLRYLLTYFRRAALNPLMPFSLLGGGLAVAWLFWQATAAASVGLALVGTLLGLAVLEHLFLALPLHDELLWRWVLRRARPSGGSPA